MNRPFVLSLVTSCGRLLTRSIALLLCSLCLAGPADAAAPGSGASMTTSDVNYDPGPIQRRGGFTIGLVQQMGLGVASGYPLEVEALNEPSAKETTKAGLGPRLGLWLGASMRDFLSFGVGLTTSSILTKERISGQPAFLVHLEAFPFFYKGGLYRDIGFSFDGGIATGVIFDRDGKKAGDEIANGGAMSMLSLGAFWEPLRFWHFSAGPTVNYVYAYSQSMKVHQAALGLRLVFYAKQPRKNQKKPATVAGF